MFGSLCDVPYKLAVQHAARMQTAREDRLRVRREQILGSPTCTNELQQKGADQITGELQTLLIHLQTAANPKGASGIPLIMQKQPVRLVLGTQSFVNTSERGLQFRHR